MDEALAQWLGLREAVDTASRSTALTQVVADHVAAVDPVNIVDLATGTGSNLRYLAPRLSPDQRWLVVDRSLTLLGELPRRTASWGAAHGYDVVGDASGFRVSRDDLRCRVEIRQADLDRPDPGIFEGCHLVTASALLDLVSEKWLRSLASGCRAVRAAALFTITYNGRSSCSPAEPEDAMVLDFFNRHQHTDKGLGGPAAGPDAVVCAARAFVEAGYRVRVEPSDWRLGPGDAELQGQLVDGWAEAAAEVSPADAGLILDWRTRRVGHITAGRSRIVVGHHDLAALPPGQSG